MIFDPENIPIRLNDWFSSRIEYEGPGHAEFFDPPGAVEGSTRVRINDRGTARIEWISRELCQNIRSSSD